MKINVRKEVVRCNKCKCPQDFIYLSDFAYGQTLVFLNNSDECAFENMIEDKNYTEYVNVVKNILTQYEANITDYNLGKCIEATFGITCDKINGNEIDFSKDQGICKSCGSTEFENIMIEPESMMVIDIPVISHNEWEKLSENEKYERILNELKKKEWI